MNLCNLTRTGSILAIGFATALILPANPTNAQLAMVVTDTGLSEKKEAEIFTRLDPQGTLLKSYQIGIRETLRALRRSGIKSSRAQARFLKAMSLSLCDAIENSDYKMVYSLVDRRIFNVNDQRQRGFGSTGLHCAAEKSLKITNFLLARGADPNLPDDFGVTPLLRAVRRMLSVQKDVTLDYPRRSTSLGIVRALLKGGANLDMPDNQGRTPREVAKKSEDKELIKIIDPQAKL